MFGAILKATDSLFQNGMTFCRNIFTQTIKLYPLDVYVCQVQMYERISFKFSPYKL